ncbi:thiol-disulfide oxidoreductase [Ruegeria sp. ANG-R]|uniref:thiol-disulfide oxidoreductase DCC family protein n=1 Tax=Ruegeria sp. ANG-R TaxID=1577903 RepID=UPI00057F649A|nr:DCC1-like thiol-disulfide oxidoreductase family protein [Ruegeria sp. ANG-R]KIC42182.1 thiol-disulfide oxidoreductase [Ruegeria sp. ANG-R]
MTDFIDPDTDLIVFDGECVLCSGFFQFMLRHDRDERFRFATAQSPLGQHLYSCLKLPTREFETNLVIVGGKVYQKLDAFAAAMQALPGAWPVLSLCRFLPPFLKNPLYQAIARNRYALFGRHETCLIPDASLRSRFVPDGF